MTLLRRIECHISASGMSPTRVGRDAVGDPRFVFDLRAGREPRAETVSRVRRWLDNSGQGSVAR